MTEPRAIRVVSHRAIAVLVAVAFASGLLVSLAVRPPTQRIGKAPSTDILPGDTIRWRTPSAFGQTLPILGEHMRNVSDRVRSVSRGRLEIEVFDPGKLVPSFSISQAVRDGKVEAGFTWLGYDMGRIPVAPLLSSVPFGMEPWEFTAWWYEGGGQQMAQEAYHLHGVHPVLCGVIGPETAGWFRTEIKRVDDLVGLKIRFAGLGGRVLQNLGASVTVIPAGEIYPALEKGAIDATEFSLPEIDQRIGFDRIVGHNLFPGWHQPFTAFHLIIHPDRWTALDESTRAAVESACTAGVTRMLARAEATQGTFLERLKARGVTAERLPEPLLAKLREATTTMLATEAARAPQFARVLESQRAFRAQYRTWRRLAYLTLEETAP